jgi:hypothetical protein
MHSFTLDPANPTGTAQVAGISGGTSLPDGLYTVTLSYRDAAGNPVATASAANVRIDTTPPAVTPPADVTVHATSLAGAVVTFADAMATDAVGVVSLAAAPPSGSAFANGMSTVTVTAKDAAGNTGTATFKVTVTPLTAVESWRYQYFGTASPMGAAGNLSDPDGDGTANVLELGFGTDPTLAGGAELEYAGTFAGGGTIVRRGLPRTLAEGSDVRAVFMRRGDFAAAGLSYEVEFSAGLGSWQTSAATPAVLADDGTWQIVAVPFPGLVNGEPARFFRVRVDPH